MRIAIVGSGISGLTAAYLLNQKFDIHLFEANDRLGGHTATIDVQIDDKQYGIDTGFIVYNDRTYPNFIRLLDKLGVATQETSMGFSVSNSVSGLEYAGNNLNTLFAQRKNIVSASFWRMLKDIVRFNRQARKDLQQKNVSDTITLGEYLQQNNYSDEFAHSYLIPMGAAIWSASFSTMRDFPLRFFIQFFLNHGLLDLTNRPQWRVIKGGSKTYIPALTRGWEHKITLNAGIREIHRGDFGVRLIMANGDEFTFDQLVIATHSDQALALLGEGATEKERAVLNDIPYQNNSVVLHTDTTLLPKSRRTWSSWNYLLQEDSAALPVLTYDMNILQGIDAPVTFCVTLNADEQIDPDKVLGRFNYAHPQFSRTTMVAQGRWEEINGVDNTWFCGAYWGNGFHEDGVNSALRITEQLGIYL